eukprot:TRINITY_DN49002_c0_g2_i1.p1 TRINITY_DN49002_c0_g2~~TRINITY_DN49002_c0_g2_i1.p1  ORF type:complete len:312 (-),score=43.57 TRINITY_DN49002_c0_g2_i1:861-1796(-)
MSKTTMQFSGGWDERERAQSAHFPPAEEMETKVQKIMNSLQNDGTLASLVDPNKISDHDLVTRFLIQWKFDWKVAETKVREMVKFRREFASRETGSSIDKLSSQPLPSAWALMRCSIPSSPSVGGQQPSLYLSGWCGSDLRGRPVFYDRFAKEAITHCKHQQKEILSAQVAHLEHLRAFAKSKGCDRVVNIMDLRNLPSTAVAHVHFVQTLRQAGGLMSNFYPEMTATIFVAFAPGPIQKAWNVLLGVIPDRVKLKFVMLPTGKKEPAPLDVLLNFIPKESIPADLGGDKPMNQLLPLDCNATGGPQTLSV